MKRTLSQKEYLDAEFRLLGITPHITHLRQPEDCYYRMVTVAAPYHILYADLAHDLRRVFAAAGKLDIPRFGLGRFVIERFSKNHWCGVALCHHLDQFDRKRGCIISEGRLLKFERRLRA